MSVNLKWKKLGLIFDPTNHQLANNCVEYAQSPQVLPLKNGIRIYFSTRERDAVGKFLSHISFVEYDKEFSKITTIARHTIIPLGSAGDFDEHGIFPMHIFQNNGEIWGYTAGWNRKVSVSVDASIGLAISRDGGLTFNKVGRGPVLTSSLHEPFLIGDACVIKRENTYHMWYIFGLRWFRPTPGSEPERVYKIGHATSLDGVQWEKEGRAIISDKIGADECQALPSVLYFNGLYHMVFCFRSATGFRTDKNSAYRLGYAYSRDLLSWNRDDNALDIDVSPDGWDSEMMCYPHIFAYNGQVWLLYNGNNFGKHGFGLAVLQSN